jgi:hypothetical protein
MIALRISDQEGRRSFPREISQIALKIEVNVERQEERRAMRKQRKTISWHRMKKIAL